MSKKKTLAPSGTRKLELEPHNFRVNSGGWQKKTDLDGQEYQEAPSGDIWELINCKDHPELNGEQLFTWDAAMRETREAGKRIPTDEEWSMLLKTTKDMPNLLFAGRRATDGLFANLGSLGSFWSSLESGGSAWRRFLYSGTASVFRATTSKASGFSVRCLQD